MGAGSQITISGVTIKDGVARPTDASGIAKGGGVLNEQATLTLSNDIITGNQAEADLAGVNLSGGTAEGGGVDNAGTLNLVNSNVNGNTVSADGAEDHAGGAASGGGVFSTGTMTVRGSTIEGNFANAKGGGDVNGTPAQLAGQIAGSAIGGGLDLSQAGPTSISDSTLRDNVADGSAGPGAPPSPSDIASGGGAYLDTNNTDAAITETNVTYAGNTAREVGGKAEGGGVTLVDTSTRQSLTNVTIFGNTATAGTTNQGAISSSTQALPSRSRTRSSLPVRAIAAPRTAACSGR